MGNGEFMKRIKRTTQFQHIQPPTQREITTTYNEFHLHKPENSTKTTVEIEDIVEQLRKTKNNKAIQLGRELLNTEKTVKILPKPAEKAESEKIRRQIGYDKVKKNLSRWDAIVTKNKFDSHKVFPVVADMDIKEKSEKPSRCIKSDLMIQLEAIDKKLKDALPEDGLLSDKLDEHDATKEQLIIRRKELARMKMKESQEILKARLRNKIKSKRYHKLLKRNKIARQIKYVEALKKSDPEKALEMMQQIELSRIEERATLRHKNTGSWAKNSKIRASYDSEARKSLAEQVALSREMTQKTQVQDESEDDDDKMQVEQDLNAKDIFNPWLTKSKKLDKTKNQNESDGMYRKYWLERNKNEQVKMEYTNDDVEPQNKKTEKEPKAKKSEVISGWFVEDLNETHSARDTTSNLDDIFDEAEELIEEKLEKHLTNVKTKTPSGNNSKTKKSGRKMDPETYKSGLEFKKVATYAEFDEEMNELPTKSGNLDKNKTVDILSGSNTVPANEQIDPNSFVEVKTKVINLGYTASEEMHNESTENKLTLADAFLDDDVVADFNQEIKDKEIEKEVDLTMPGWGSWAGCGIAPQKNKLKLNLAKGSEPTAKPKGPNININERAVNRNLKEHLVSDLPFPFKNVKDFEGSIRAPLGRNFVPETAFRKLTRPEVVVKIGKVIEPMDANHLQKENV